MSNITVLFKIKYLNKDATNRDVKKRDVINSINEHFRTNKKIVKVISVSLNRDKELLTAVLNPHNSLVLQDYKNLCLKVNDKYEIRIESVNELKNKSSTNQNNRLNTPPVCKKDILDVWENDPKRDTNGFSIHGTPSLDQYYGADKEQIKERLKRKSSLKLSRSEILSQDYFVLNDNKEKNDDSESKMESSSNQSQNDDIQLKKILKEAKEEDGLSRSALLILKLHSLIKLYLIKVGYMLNRILVRR
jgi:hypothetical protein